jgi:peptide/nickel transport system substrate-binding protein
MKGIPLIKKTNKSLGLAAIFTASILVMAGCAPATTGSTDAVMIVGTTDKVTALDPAGSYDNGSFAVMNQVFPFLFNSVQGSADMVPDIAESGEFISPTVFQVKLKSGLTFANGNALTASDVKFTFDRQQAIADDNGPSYLLGNLVSTEAVDDVTVNFTLGVENDQIFKAVLSSPAAPIVDEDVFSADSITSDDDIVAGNAFAGQYVISSYTFNELIEFVPNASYAGVLGAAQNASVSLKFYANESNMKLDIQQGNIDVATRSLSATNVADLDADDNVNVIYGPGGEIRYIVFNFDTMPFGATTGEADAAKALAVRQAAAHLIDRDALSTQVYKGTYLPLYSYVPPGLPGANEAVKDLYGATPNQETAARVLADAGVETPVALNLQWNPDHYGESSADEYALVKSQLEQGGLFTVGLQSTEWVTYIGEALADGYPAYQLGWFPDYSDAENYLVPFFLEGGFLNNHFNNEEVNTLLKNQVGEADVAKRTAMIEDIQNKVAAEVSTLPLLYGAQVAVAYSGVQGVILDASFKLRFGSINK